MRPSTIPSIFNDGFFDNIFKDIDDSTKWYNAVASTTNSAYPYNVEVETDKNGNLIQTVLTIALAGIPRDNIEMKVVDNVLYISVDKSEVERVSEEDSNWSTQYKGISTRSQKYKFRLHDIDEERIKSRFENGLLEIALPAVKHKEVQIKID
jgi:HSP20 family molecular chaperone IbpA